MANQQTSNGNGNGQNTRTMWDTITAPIRTSCLCIETVTSCVATTAIVAQHATYTAAAWCHNELDKTDKSLQLSPEAQRWLEMSRV